jgi:metal-dependent amidase/aminoacylase/carboxypeptidase family protein
MEEPAAETIEELSRVEPDSHLLLGILCAQSGARAQAESHLETKRSPRRCTRTSRPWDFPEWSEADQKLAMALQDEMGFDPREGEEGPGGVGLRTDLSELMGPAPEPRTGGGSDDIGDIAWNVPTVTLSFLELRECGGHHWSSAVAMATPIAHKGATARAKVVALTALDFFLDAMKVEAAWKYFRGADEGCEVHPSHPGDG